MRKMVGWTCSVHVWRINSWRILDGKPEWMRPFERSTLIWKDNIKIVNVVFIFMNLTDSEYIPVNIFCEHSNKICLVEVRRFLEKLTNHIRKSLQHGFKWV
jgi:hypothetical protein